MNSRTVLYAAVGAAVASAAATNLGASSPELLKEMFEDFKAQYRSNYRTMDDENYRFGVFVKTLQIIDERNAANDGSVHGITRFADLTQEEFQNRYLDMHVADKIRGTNATIVQVPAYVGSATSADYVGKQTTAVKDQGQCGSCFAFAAAEQIESDGMRLLGNDASLTLSVQQIVSCDHGEGQEGCEGGGLQEMSFDYVRDNGGITTDAAYPYTAKTGSCDKSKNDYVMGVTKYDMIRTEDLPQSAAAIEKTEADFTSYVLSTGTLSIGVDATTWSTYKSGIMSSCGKGKNINHSVQIVGVDTDSETGYWKIRNSWTPSWGEDGFIRVKYGQNTCGLATEGGSYTTVFNI
jgi:C1A family cysteine protease